MTLWKTQIPHSCPRNGWEKLGMIPLEFSSPFPAPLGSRWENPHRSKGFPALIPRGNSKEKEKSGRFPHGSTWNKNWEFSTWIRAGKSSSLRGVPGSDSRGKFQGKGEIWEDPARHHKAAAGSRSRNRFPVGMRRGEAGKGLKNRDKKGWMCPGKSLGRKEREREKIK